MFIFGLDHEDSWTGAEKALETQLPVPWFPFSVSLPSWVKASLPGLLDWILHGVPV